VRLTINNENVSYSLEQERTLGEVVHGVSAWLGAGGFVIMGLNADGRDLLQSPAGTWGGTAVEGIATLAVSATHTGDMKIAHWRTVDRWLGMLEEEVAGTGSSGAETSGTEASGTETSVADPLADLLEGLPQTLEGFAANSFLPPGSDTGTRFAAAFSGRRPSDVRAWSTEARREAIDLVRQLRGLVQARLDDVANPREALVRCAVLLRECRGELKEVSVLLQTGRDRAAMESVVRFTDAVQSLMDLLPFLPPDTGRARLLVELTPILRELVAAFGSHDSVLIGDLLEYEVAGRWAQAARPF
jgi:hypothetical protein